MRVVASNGRLLHITTLLLVALLCSASSSSTSSSSRTVYWLQENYPNPESNPTECRSNSRICDPDSILDHSEAMNIIEKKIDSFEQHHTIIVDCTKSSRPLFSIKTAETTSTKNNQEGNSKDGDGDNKDTDGGVPIQIGVALVRHMDLSPFGEYNDEIDIAAESFATHLHNKWGVGSSLECGSTGVLIFLSINDRAIYISKGQALKSVLNDKRLDRLINTIKPYLRDEQYMDAIIELIDNISVYIHNGEPTLYEHFLHNLDDYGTLLIFAVFFIIKIFYVRRQTQSQRDYAHVQSQLNQIDRDRAESLQGIYQCKSCPICLEPFQTVTTDNNTNNTTPKEEDDDEKEDETNNHSNEKSDDDGNGDSPSDTAAAIASTTTTETTTDEDDDGTNDDEQQKTASAADKMSNSRIGSDGKPLKLLRCGHVFDETCWSEWIANGRSGSINKCPICQQDVGGGGSGGSGASGARATGIRDNSSASTTLRHRSNSGDQQRQQQQEEEQEETTLVDDDHHQSQQQQRQQDHQNERIIQQYNRERNFRLARLAYRYPRYIQQQQIQRWTSPNYDHDGSQQMSRDSSFVRNNPAHQRSTSSSSGSYRSGGGGFGGGGSSGGRGGRW